MKRLELLRFSASPLLRLMFMAVLITGGPRIAIAQPENFEYVCGTSSAVTGPGGGGPENPICTDPNTVRYIRVAVHFLLREQILIETYMDNCVQPNMNRTYIGPGNFTETSDGFGNFNYNGFQHAENFISLANQSLANNQDHWRKTPGENYPTPPPAINIQYLLTGVYFHRDNDAFAGLGSESGIHAKYDIEGNNVLDIYCIHDRDLPYDGNAFFHGSSNKYVYLTDYKLYMKPLCREWSKLNTARSLNHEIGHTLNLHHTWDVIDFSEGCADTPLGYVYDNLKSGVCTLNVNANCYTYNPNIQGCPRKPCDEWHKISNNVMDYNEQAPAWTVCQIARMNNNLQGNGNPYIHSCNGCAPSQAFFYTRSPQRICPPEMGLNSDVHLYGVSSVNENRYLIEICEVNPGQPGNCIAGYYTSGWQTGQVGDINLSTLYAFQADKTYRIKLSVDNTECPGSDVHEQLLTTLDCAQAPPCCFDLAALNPFSGYLTVYYNAPESGTLSLDLVHIQTGTITLLYPGTTITAGEYQQDFQTGALPAGNYTLRAFFRGTLYTKNIVKF
jgi:hypothetical protein